MSATVGAAIAGLGMTAMGKVYDRSATSLAAEAVRAAVADAGLNLSDLDGLLVSSGVTQGLGVGLAQVLGLSELNVLNQVSAFGATAGVMVAAASQAIAAGAATTIACVFSDTPLKPASSAGESWSGRKRERKGLAGWSFVSGAVNPNILYALCARRHMERYGTTSEQLARIAVAQRAWATLNPMAQMRDPITIEEHQASRWIAEPLHLLDCCLVSNGAVAVLVTSSERAATLRRPPVSVLGYGQAHAPRRMQAGSDWGLVTPAVRSGAQAMGMAGIGVDDVDIAELYDCYTYTVLVSLEDYGFCGKGEGGDYVSDGRLGPGGKLACNTGGGQLSSYYMWGFTPLSEAVIQARGDGGERQAPRNDIILVSGNGGILEHHATLVLGAA